MKLLREEIVAGIRNRGVTDRYPRFQSYAAGRVNATAGGFTGSELTGNCRCMVQAPDAQHAGRTGRGRAMYSRLAHGGDATDHEGLAGSWPSRPRRWTPASGNRTRTRRHVADQALEMIKQSLTRGPGSYCAALAAVKQVGESASCRPIWCPCSRTQNRVGHTLVDRGTGRRLCDLMEKMDRAALHDGGRGARPVGRCAAAANNSSRCRTRATWRCRA